MKPSPYDHMQRAVDIVNDSPHPTNKVAATVAGVDQAAQDFAVSSTNFWPAPIQQAFAPDARIGNSSGTIHAETACILKAPVTKGAALYVTDPPCPNCVKYTDEAGIRTLYIDSKGFDKDFAQRRGHHFESMSMQICEKAGIAVYKIFRKEQRLETIWEPEAGYRPIVEKPPVKTLLTGAPDMDALVAETQERYGDEPFAVAIADAPDGQVYALSAEIHPVIGYTQKTIEEPDSKYSFYIQPVNRLLMTAAYYGLKIRDGGLYSSRIPSAREQVNFIGAGLRTIIIGDINQSRDEYGTQALDQLRDAGVLVVL